MKINTLLFILSLLFINSFTIFCKIQLSDKEFASPSNRYKPYVWWHWIGSNISHDGIKKDLEAMKDVGIGGATIFNISAGFKGEYSENVSYYNDKWWGYVKYAVQEAKRLNLEIGLHNCPGYSASGGPWITPELSMQKLVWSKTVVTGNILYDNNIQIPEVNLDYYNDICVLAIPSEGVVRLIDIIDISEKMDLTGRLVWSVPNRNYTIYRFGHTTTGKETHPKPGNFLSLEADKLNEKAMIYHANNVLEPIINTLGSEVGKTFKHITFDSYEAGKQNWTNNMREEFIKRRGYDVTRWLPALTGIQICNNDSTKRFLNDFNSVIIEMFAEYGYETPSTVFKKAGLQVYIEPYGGTFNLSDVTIIADIPMSEFWTNSNLSISNIAKSAKPYDINIVAAEAFTGWPSLSMWSETPGKLKASGDRAFALSGVNRLFLHSWVHQPFPDHIKPGMCMNWWGTHFGRNQTWHNYSSKWLKYLSRCQYLLQSSKEEVDVLTLSNYPVSLDIPVEGHLISERTLLDNVYTKKGKIIVKSSQKQYSILTLPNSSTMKLSILKKIESLVKEGAVIFGERPKSPESLSDSNEEFQLLTNKLWGNDNNLRSKGKTYYKGKIFEGQNIKEVYGFLSFRNDSILDTENLNNLHWNHKVIDDTHVYFFTNTNEYEMEFSVDLNNKNKEPEIWYPETGKINTIYEYISNKDRMLIKLRIKGNESFFLVFRKPLKQKVFKSFVQNENDSSTYTLLKSNEGNWAIKSSYNGLYSINTKKGKVLKTIVNNIPSPEKINGYWNVKFKPASTSDSFDVKLIELESWTNSTDKRIKFFSGTAIYSNIFNINKKVISSDIKIQLDLGTVKDIAEITINGNVVDTLWHSPYVTDITNYVHSGINKIEIAVTNTWANRLIGDEQFEDDCIWGESKLFHRLNEKGEKPPVGKSISELPEWLIKNYERPSKERTTFSTWNYFSNKSNLLESGLMNQIQIIYEKVSVLNER
jgi:hypothetical protein